MPLYQPRTRRQRARSEVRARGRALMAARVRHLRESRGLSNAQISILIQRRNGERI